MTIIVISVSRSCWIPSRNQFGTVHQMERTISVWSDRNIRDQLWRWSTLTNLVILVGPKCPFPFYKIVVPSTALLYPSYESNNQTRGGLACRVCATEMYPSIGPVKFPKFQTEVFVEWKTPLGFGIQNKAQGIRSSTNNWIIQVTWNPEKPRRGIGIQNPTRSWIPLHGAISGNSAHTEAQDWQGH